MVIPCIAVGPDYLGAEHASPYDVSAETFLTWSGTLTSAQLVAYEFNAGGSYGRYIYINGVKIGSATGTRGGEPLCRGFKGRQPLTWDIPPSLLIQGQNSVRITIDPGQTGERSWGLSRAQIEVSGTDVDGRHYSQVTVPSTYNNNWTDYADEGTYTHIMEPQGYDNSRPTPLLIGVHGYQSSGQDSLSDYHNAANAKGWLVAAGDLHGEVFSDYYESAPVTHQLYPATGKRVLSARAAQQDIIDILNYMGAHYNVDPTRIYLAGHSMGGLTGLVTAARLADVFAAVVSDSGPTDLAQWEVETSESPDPVNPVISYHIRTETGTYTTSTHKPLQQRYPSHYPYEYERRTALNYAANFKHVPLLIMYPASDTKVLPHHSTDMYLQAQQYAPDHVELVPFPGVHGDRIQDHGNYTVAWLNRFTRPVGDAPEEISFTADTQKISLTNDGTFAHFWMGVQPTVTAANAAHFVRVNRATYQRNDRFIEADVENLRPLTGDPAALGVPAPKDDALIVNLTFDLARIGLPTGGAYTVERLDKDKGVFTQEFATAMAGKLSVLVPRGSYILRLTAGNQPPSTQVLKLRQGWDGYTGVQDTYLSGWADLNYSSSATLSLRAKDEAPLHNPALKFDLSRLPTGAYLRYAILTMKVSTPPGSAMPAQVYAIKRAWKVTEATWSRASAGVPWRIPGAEGVPDDRADQPSDTRTIYPDTLIADRYGFNVTDIVAGWLANTGANQGFLIHSDPVNGIYLNRNDGMTWGAAESSSQDRRPELTLIYTLEKPTPVPTATPTVTPTALPTATPTPTSTSTATPTATATPEVGAIAGVVFVDSNGDGTRDPDELGTSGKLVQLWQGEAVYDNAITDQQGYFTFVHVPPGVWQVLLTLPGNYQITTGANPAEVTVINGVTYALDYGIAPVATPTATPTTTGSPTPTATATRWRTYLPLVLAAH